MTLPFQLKFDLFCVQGYKFHFHKNLFAIYQILNVEIYKYNYEPEFLFFGPKYDTIMDFFFHVYFSTFHINLLAGGLMWLGQGVEKLWKSDELLMDY